MSNQVIELQQKVKILIDTGSNEIIQKNEMSLNVAIKEIAKDMNFNKVEVNDKIESLLSRMNLDKLESN